MKLIIKIPGFPDITSGAASAGGGFGYGGFSTETNEFQIIFDKYFQYDDGSGNPIYDQNTGATLRDPVTGQPV
jgi:hypothetical protein